jgi:lipid II:glycine glycyltransferase (peptidoglycan interpeptide bridge formation enzyme)
MLTVAENPATWDAFVSQAADASLLQSWAWGELKSRYGWRAARYFWLRGETPIAAISILKRPLRGGLALHYAPRGPILDGHPEEWPQMWAALKGRLAGEGGTILKVDPEWTTPEAAEVLRATGAVLSRNPIQHQATFIVDIRGGQTVFARLKASTRRNMRLAERAGVVIGGSQTASSMEVFYGLLKDTAGRQGFVVRPLGYYQDLLQVFAQRGQITIYLARHAEKTVAGNVMMFYGKRVIYLFGASNDEGREMRAPYLLQQRAIEDAQERRCTSYDMWGVPLNPVPTHPGYGYYTFKSMFNGELVRFIGMYDLAVRQPMASAVRLVERVARPATPEFV